MTSSPRRSGRRSTAALLASLALAAGLAGCGDDGGAYATATDPASSSPTETSTEPPTETPSETTPESSTATSPDAGAGGQKTVKAVGSAGVTEATLISGTEGGGSASGLSSTLDSEQAVADFAAQFNAGFAATVQSAATQLVGELEAGSTAYGATAAIGCDAPLSVTVDAGEAGFEVTAKLPQSSVQCLAPVTYVVLFAVPDA